MKNKLSVTMTATEQITGLIYLVVQILLLPYVLFQGNLLLGNPLTVTQLNFVAFCIDFLCVTLIFHNFLLASVKDALTRPWGCLRAAFLGLILYWVASFLVNNFIAAVYPDFYNVNDASIAGMTRENYTLMAIGTVILVPVVEETLFRGLIFRGLYNRHPVLGYAVSALCFGALHVLGYIGRYSPVHLLLCLIQYLPAGLCLGWAYVKADSIWAPILMHITINQIGILSMG